MKNLMFIAFIAMVLTVFNACEKDSAIVESQTLFVDDELRNIGFSVDDNCLVFESEKEFQKMINYLVKKGDKYFPEFEKAIGFESYRLYYDDRPGRSDKLIDDLIATVINPCAKIVIGGYRFEVDFKKEKIEVFPIDELKNASISEDSKKMIFDWKDDIFALLNNENILKSSYCTSDQDKKFNTELFGGDSFGNEFWDNIQLKLCYQNLGFIHTMISKSKIVQVLFHNGNLPLPIFRFMMDITGEYKRKNKNPGIVDEHIEGYVQNHDDEISWRPFYGTRRVEYFSITSNYSFVVVNSYGMYPLYDGLSDDFTQLSISCN